MSAARVLLVLCLLAGPSADAQTAEAWRSAVDDHWGGGHPADVQLAVFDAVWTRADTAFAAFASAPVDWDAQRARYRPEVAEGVSRGRFAAILNHLALSLRETHTAALDTLVNRATDPAPGVPLLVGAIRGDNGHFGACLTPLPDGTLLVYDAVPGHPLGLAVGDVVVGYDGTPWRDLYPALLAAELPIWLRDEAANGDPPWSRSLWGAAPSAFEHGWLAAAGLNWHLFDRIDVRRRDGALDSRPVSPLADAALSIRCTEQLPVPGVPFPVPDWHEGDRPPDAGTYVSSGVVEGTRIGYVYVWSWYWGHVRDDFRRAVEAFVGDPTVRGLVVDFRFNHGGFPFHGDDGFALLFDERVETLEMVHRADRDDRLALVRTPGQPAGPLVVPGDPATSFDRPIAILTGPGAYSAGDFNAVRLRYHPRARTFGASTGAAFTPALSVRLPDEFSAWVAFLNARRVDAPDALLVHAEQTPDEPVWLAPDDVVRGEDTVVRRALDWIDAAATSEEAEPLADGPSVSVAPNPVVGSGVVTVSLDVAAAAHVALYDALGREVVTVADRDLGPGEHRWPLRTDGLASGVYLLRVRAGDRAAVRRVTVLR